MRNKTACAAMLAVLLLAVMAGCSGSGKQDNLKEVKKEAAAGQGNVTEFAVNTTDGVVLRGTRFVPDHPSEKAVLLLHMLGRSRRDWEPLVPTLLQEGYKVYTVDLRGMGESTTKNGKAYSFRDFNPLDYQKMREDIPLVASEIEEDQFDLIGASIGANLALDYAANSEGQMRVRKLVLMSPGENYRGIETVSRAGKVKAETLILASEEDSYAAESGRKLAEKIANSRVKIYSGLGHGTNMLSSDEVTNQILSFLNETNS